MKTDRELLPTEARSLGFTLMELLVSMVVVMVILAGLYSNFLMQSRVQTSQSSTVDAIEDLRLASEIMATQLRLAYSTCWDATNNRLIYQPLGASAKLDAAACTAATAFPYTVDSSWGDFQFSTGTAATGGTLCWNRPNVGGNTCDQMLRGLSQTPNPTGFTVSPVNNASMTGMRSLTLVSQYKNVDRKNKQLTVRLDVLPRNNN